MAIQDFEKIDMIVGKGEGSVELVAIDTGKVVDPDDRFRMVLKKLLFYLHYVISDQFQEDNPNASREKVTFRVQCATPATDEMRGIAVMKHPEHPNLKIGVEFEVATPAS